MIHEKIEIQLKDSEFKANLFTYFLDNSPEIEPERKRSVVLICPGGGYQMTSDREAEALAVRFMAMGYHAAILRYSVAPARFPEALLQWLQQLQCSVKMQKNGILIQRRS